MDERMDITLNRFRSRINSYPPGMCPLVLYRSILQMSLNQSCGKCVPCRDGLSEVDRLFGSVDVYEEHERPGGMLRYGIPEYKVCAVRVDKI